jgi:hypothetical protein
MGWCKPANNGWNVAIRNMCLEPYCLEEENERQLQNDVDLK